MRIGRALSQLGVCSRRSADEYLSSHDVRLQGEQITRLDFQVPEGSTLHIDGHAHQLRQDELTYCLHKPVGFVCTHEPQGKQKSMFELMPDDAPRLYYAGRLDLDSRGLVVLSTNGNLVHDLTHPSKKVEKVYHVHAARPLSEDEIARLLGGVYDRSDRLRFHQLKALKKPAHYEITLTTGKNREIRRALGKLSIGVIDLLRLSIGSYKLGDLAEGEYRLTSG